MKKILTIPLAFLLTAALIFFCVSLIGNRILSPAMGEGGAQASDSVIRQEMGLIRERITEMSALYGFTPEPVIEYIDEDTVRELNRQASAWWNVLVKEARTGDEIIWNTVGLEDVLFSDPMLSGGQDRDAVTSNVYSIAGEISETVLRIVLPMRQNVIRVGLQEVRKRVDLANLISFFLDVPWTALALCGLLSGLIALLEFRNLRKALPYFGSALGAAALVLVVLVVLYLAAGILPMVREASQSLTIQYRTVATGAVITAAVMAAVMAAGCVLCMRRGRKENKTA